MCTHIYIFFFLKAFGESSAARSLEQNGFLDTASVLSHSRLSGRETRKQEKEGEGEGTSVHCQ